MKIVCSVIASRELDNSFTSLPEFLIKSVLYVLHIGIYHLVKYCLKGMKDTAYFLFLIIICC